VSRKLDKLPHEAPEVNRLDHAPETDAGTAIATHLTSVDLVTVLAALTGDHIDLAPNSRVIG
jgi:hypothetical protein